MSKPKQPMPDLAITLGELQARRQQHLRLLGKLDALRNAGLITPELWASTRDELVAIRDDAHQFLCGWGQQRDPRREPVVAVPPLPDAPPRTFRLDDIEWSYHSIPGATGHDRPVWVGTRLRNGGYVCLTIVKRGQDVRVELLAERNLRAETRRVIVEAFLNLPTVYWHAESCFVPLQGHEQAWWSAVAAAFPGCPLPKKWAHLRQP